MSPLGAKASAVGLLKPLASCTLAKPGGRSGNASAAAPTARATCVGGAEGTRTGVSVSTRSSTTDPQIFIEAHPSLVRTYPCRQLGGRSRTHRHRRVPHLPV